jgi:membrane protein DedA with SNARE-associated domain
MWNAIGGVLWVISVIGAGYLAGASWPKVVGWLGAGSTVLVVGAGVALAVIGARTWRRRRAGPPGPPPAADLRMLTT